MIYLNMILFNIKEMHVPYDPQFNTEYEFFQCFSMSFMYAHLTK